MVRINIKPLSVNEAWKGVRYKTDKYLSYQNKLLYMLPNIELPQPPYEVSYKFGFSNSASDIDNPVKLLQDILSKKYGFNDKLIKRIIIESDKVKNGDEYIEFNIKTLVL
jgi:Holliday junction resolvase RusA-like endonuclease